MPVAGKDLVERLRQSVIGTLQLLRTERIKQPDGVSDLELLGSGLRKTEYVTAAEQVACNGLV